MKNAVVSVNDAEVLVGFVVFTNLSDKIEDIAESQSYWEDWTK